MLPRIFVLFHPFEEQTCREAYRVWFGSYPPEKLRPVMARPEETYWAWLPDFYPDLPLPRWIGSILQ